MTNEDILVYIWHKLQPLHKTPIYLRYCTIHRVCKENTGKMGSGWSQERSTGVGDGVATRQETGFSDRRHRQQQMRMFVVMHACVGGCCLGGQMVNARWVDGEGAPFWVGHKQLFVVCLTVGPVFSTYFYLHLPQWHHPNIPVSEQADARKIYNILGQFTTVAGRRLTDTQTNSINARGQDAGHVARKSWHKSA